MCATMEAFSPCLGEDRLLLTAVGNMLAVLGDVADGVQPEFFMLRCDVSALMLTGPISHFFLWLPFGERCFVLTQSLLPDGGQARRHLRSVQH